MDITELRIDSNQIVYWFDALRNLQDGERNRALDAFWSSQIRSKCWLVNNMNSFISEGSNIYIFGGWVGVLSSLLFQNTKINNIVSVDIDPWCEKVANTICHPYVVNNSFKAITSDMKNFIYDFDTYPDIIINTSTEHVTQQTYDQWYDKIPNNSLIVIQGNNFFSCDEHIRCNSSLLDFKIMNHVSKPIFEDELNLGQFTRYMAMFYK